MSYDKTGIKTPQDFGDGWGTNLDRKLTSQEVHENFKWAALFGVGIDSLYYKRAHRFRAASNTARTTLSIPILYAEINGTGYYYSGGTFDLDSTSAWDDTTYQTPSNRAGKDFYIYAGVPSSGYEADIVLSANATVPSGHTADTSRKIGGFHCLCVDIGTNAAPSSGDVTLWPLDDVYDSHDISGNTHWLNGYVAGDILPFSIWDLYHRPESSPEGMVYDPWSGKWVDIYLASWSGGQIVSVNGGTILDGASSTPGKFHWYNFAEHYAQILKRMAYRAEFMSFAFGVPQGVNIDGGSAPGTTTGHTATDGNRIVSNIGVEDAAGVMWQWGNDMGATTDQGSSWEPADTYDSTWAYTGSANPEGDTGSYDHLNSIRRGGHYEDPNRPLFGGYWGAGARCGSGAALWYNRALHLSSPLGSRGVAEPRR